MSVQFGKCNFDRKPVDPQDLDEVRPVLAPYGPDGEGFICKDNFAILYRAFHTTKESWRETQPYVSASGFVLTWDGRLDNRKDLIERLAGETSPGSTDLEIVAAAYDRWGTDAFRDLIGDWALSVWNPKDQSLIFAKDFLGTRHLYYSIERDRVTWCSILDPLVLFARPFKLQEEYVAGWLTFFPAVELTPYVGVRSVPPSTFVQLRERRERVTRYWDFDAGTRIRYRSDREYEEQFRSVFSESVRRRLRSDAPVIAELSGGMDSSSIVCVADDIISQNGAAAGLSRLDTVSYYDDSEPNWNERPYFTKVEERRGCAGCHIELSSPKSSLFDFNQFSATPTGSGQARDATENFAACIVSQGNRVVLSGIGGDEVTGGIPTPVPELEDLLARGKLATLAGQLKVWALNKRKPWVHLLLETFREFFPPSLIGIPKFRQPPAWVDPHFVNRYWRALAGYPSRIRLFGPLPSFQENISALDVLRRQLASTSLPAGPCYEKRYPFLDRDLLTFLFALPPDQLVRPGQRRSLMRRALAGTVPQELLNRRRKAFVARAPLVAISAECSRLVEIARCMLSDSIGIVVADLFREQAERARDGQEIPIVPFLRTLRLELWLCTLQREGVVETPNRNTPQIWSPRIQEPACGTRGKSESSIAICPARYVANEPSSCRIRH
jgi:asparagine synthase (glutamine-hydrolysing)